jgi:hypothetical protein
VTDVEQIAARLDVLEKRVAVAEQEREAYRKLYIETMERCRKLELGLLASKSEHLPDPGPQLSLDVLSMVLDERKRAELEAALASANAEQDIPAHTRRKPTGRKPLPEHLPRVEIKLAPAWFDDDQRLWDDERLHKVGALAGEWHSPRFKSGNIIELPEFPVGYRPPTAFFRVRQPADSAAGRAGYCLRTIYASEEGAVALEATCGTSLTARALRNRTPS